MKVIARSSLVIERRSREVIPSFVIGE